MVVVRYPSVDESEPAVVAVGAGSETAGVEVLATRTSRRPARFRRVKGGGSKSLCMIYRDTLSGRGDLNPRPPAPKADTEVLLRTLICV